MSYANRGTITCETPGCFGEGRHWRIETKQWVCATCLTSKELKTYSMEIARAEKLRAQHIEKREKAKPDPRRGQFGWKFKQRQAQDIALQGEKKRSG